MTSDAWHYVTGGTSNGPFTTLELEGLIARGEVGPQTLVWNDRLPAWEPALQHFTFDSGSPAPAMGGRLGPDGLYVGAPSRGFGEAMQVCLSKYFDFSGRASRSEYWYFVLWQVLIGAIAGTIDGLSGMSLLGNLVSVALLLPALAVSWRRLHDIDRSGWWIGGFYLAIFLLTFGGLMLYGFSITSTTPIAPTGDAEVPAVIGTMLLFGALIVYMIVLLVWFCTRGTPGPNRYG